MGRSNNNDQKKRRRRPNGEQRQAGGDQPARSDANGNTPRNAKPESVDRPAKNGGRSRSGRRRGRRGGRGNASGGDSRQQPVRREINADVPREVKYRMPEPPPKREYGECPICRKPMRDIHSAIALPPSDTPAHFECVIGKIAEDEGIKENERVVYMGNGSFGIVEDQSKQGKSRYVVVRRIQFEEQDKIIGWRKELSPGISRD